MYEVFDAEAQKLVIISENTVIGILLNDGDRRLLKSSILKPSHFIDEKNRLIFEEILAADKRGEKFDFTTIYGELMQSQKIGSDAYDTLKELTESIPTLADFKFHESKVIQAYQRREASKIFRNFIEQQTSIESAINEMRALNTIVSDDLPSLNDAIDKAWMKLIDDKQGIPTGYADYDRLTKGLHAGDLIIIGARPSIGKTAFVLNLINNITKNDNNPDGCACGFFSLEMPEEQSIFRLASMNGYVPLIKFREATNSFSSEDWSKTNMAMEFQRSFDLTIFDKADVPMSEIWRKSELLRIHHGKDRQLVIVIDYLQLIQADTSKSKNEQVSEISRQLKIMARELNCVVIALAQLNRGVEQRQDKRPVLSDLRDSGSIEQDADVIGFLYRDDYYDKNSDSQNIIELNITKQRNGPLGTVELYFNKEVSRMNALTINENDGK